MPHPVGPLVLWHAARVTKYDLILAEFGCDRETLDHRTVKQTPLGIENVLARETRERAILDSRDRPAQRVHVRDHQSDSRRLRGNTFVIFATHSYRIGHASLMGKAPHVEADEAACVTRTTTAEEAAGCRSRL